MRSPHSPRRFVLLSAVAGLVVAVVAWAPAQTPLPPEEPPGWSDADEAATAAAPADAPEWTDEAYDVPVGETLFQGSMLLVSGSRIPPIPVANSPARPEVIVEGTLGGTEAELLIVVSGGTDGEMTQTVKLAGEEGTYFVVGAPFERAITTIEVANSFGDTVTIERIGLTEPTAEQTAKPAAEPATGPEGGATMATPPPPAVQPSRDFPPGTRAVAPVTAASPAPPDRRVIFRGDLSVREMQRTREFKLDPRRTCVAIEVEWWDFMRSARGRLYIGEEENSRFSDVDVDRDKPAVFPIGEAIPSITLACRKATLHITRIVVVYEGQTGQADSRAPGVAPRHGTLPPPPGLPPAPSPGRPPSGPSSGPPSRAANIVEESRPSVVNRGPSHIGRNQSKTITLSQRMHIDRVEVRWTDRRDDAQGFISIDEEPWDLRGPLDVGSPGTVNLDVDRQGLRIHLHAREDDIDVYWVRIHVRPAVGRDPGPPEPLPTPADAPETAPDEP